MSKTTIRYTLRLSSFMSQFPGSFRPCCPRSLVLLSLIFVSTTTKKQLSACIYSTTCYLFKESQNSSGWKRSLEITLCNVPLKASSVRPSCSGSCPATFWISFLDNDLSAQSVPLSGSPDSIHSTNIFKTQQIQRKDNTKIKARIYLSLRWDKTDPQWGKHTMRQTPYQQYFHAGFSHPLRHSFCNSFYEW